jgi:hypothetical protein
MPAGALPGEGVGPNRGPAGGDPGAGTHSQTTRQTREGDRDRLAVGQPLLGNDRRAADQRPRLAAVELVQRASEGALERPRRQMRPRLAAVELVQRASEGALERPRRQIPPERLVAPYALSGEGAGDVLLADLHRLRAPPRVDVALAEHELLAAAVVGVGAVVEERRKALRAAQYINKDDVCAVDAVILSLALL